MADGPKILIVDDEPNIRDLLTTSLRFAGFAVRAGGTVAQDISAVREGEPDLFHRFRFQALEHDTSAEWTAPGFYQPLG